MNNEKLDLILQSHQLILRETRWETADSLEKADIIDKQITDILNPKVVQSLRERTKGALEVSR